MPRRTTRARSRTRRRTKGPRSSWKGQLTFGLVSFPVEAVNALDRSGSDVHFHQIHADCHRRIHYEKVCPVHGAVTQEEIVSGYEVSKGRYVEIDPDELDQLRTEKDRAFTIDSFVAVDEIDPLYFDGRMYYVLPDGETAAVSYRVLLSAMEQEGVCGVGRIVFSGKDQIALLRVAGGVFHMAMLNYYAEIKPPESMAPALPEVRRHSREVKVALTLVREWTAPEFDLSEYVDPYREQVLELVASKRKGRPLPVPQEEPGEPDTINLMDALKRSVAAQRPARRGGKSRRRRRA